MLISQGWGDVQGIVRSGTSLGALQDSPLAMAGSDSGSDLKHLQLFPKGPL